MNRKSQDLLSFIACCDYKSRNQETNQLIQNTFTIKPKESLIHSFSLSNIAQTTTSPKTLNVPLSTYAKQAPRRSQKLCSRLNVAEIITSPPAFRSKNASLYQQNQRKSIKLFNKQNKGQQQYQRLYQSQKRNNQSLIQQSKDLYIKLQKQDRKIYILQSTLNEFLKKCFPESHIFNLFKQINQICDKNYSTSHQLSSFKYSIEQLISSHTEQFTNLINDNKTLCSTFSKTVGNLISQISELNNQIMSLRNKQSLKEKQLFLNNYENRQQKLQLQAIGSQFQNTKYYVQQQRSKIRQIQTELTEQRSKNMKLEQQISLFSQISSPLNQFMRDIINRKGQRKQYKSLKSILQLLS